MRMQRKEWFHLMKGGNKLPAEIYIDGASAGNPGPSGIGVFIKYDGKAESFSIPLGSMSNHEAEFTALIEGMKICVEKDCDPFRFEQIHR